MAWGYGQYDDELWCEVCGGGDVPCPATTDHAAFDAADELCEVCEGNGTIFCRHCGGGDATLAEYEPANAPEGWYPDPDHAEAVRWWDGYRWVGPARLINEYV